MQFRKPMTILLIAAVLTPIFVMLLLGVGRLLTAMQDADGALLLDRLALLLSVAWVGEVVALVLLLTVDSIARRQDDPDESHAD